MNRPFAHCPACGALLPDGGWPRHCGACSRMHFLNPLPVAVLLVPIVGRGILTVRRDIEPHRGKLALPGGFIDVEESWGHAAARELREETGVVIEPEAIELFDVCSAPDGTVLIFGIAPPLVDDPTADFGGNTEVSELAVVAEPTELAFSLHTRVLNRWFASTRSNA